MHALLYSSGRESKKGFIYVASRDRMYYEMALNSAISMRDYFPDAHITIFTHKNFVDKRSEVFDNVYVNIPIHYRAKMWCIARTPYEETVYIDCDSFIRHKDIANIHDQLNGCDMFFGSCLGVTVGNINWLYLDKANTIEPTLHGSLVGFKSTPLNLDFMQTWFDAYLEQLTSDDWPYEKDHHRAWKIFDMFTLWRMTSKRFSEFERFDGLNIKVLERRWNNTGQDYVPRPVITQVDKHTMEKMPSLWKTIEKGMKDEAYQVTKRPIKDPVIDYN